MDQAIGWHQGDTDRSVSRYWDGSRWTGELRWDGQAWVAAPVAPVVGPAAPMVGPVAGVATGPQMTPTAWTLLAGSTLAALGVFFPWGTASSAYQTKSFTPSGAGPGVVILLLGLIGVVGLLGWPSRRGTLSVGRLVGMAVVVALMGFFAMANFSSIGNDVQTSARDSDPYGLGIDVAQLTKVTVEPGNGLYLWSVGALVLAVAIVQAGMARGRRADR